MVFYDLGRIQEELKIRGTIEINQNSAKLISARILRWYQETRRELLSRRFQRTKDGNNKNYIYIYIYIYYIYIYIYIYITSRMNQRCLAIVGWKVSMKLSDTYLWHSRICWFCLWYLTHTHPHTHTHTRAHTHARAYIYILYIYIYKDRKREMEREIIFIIFIPCFFKKYKKLIIYLNLLFVNT